MPRIRTIKPDFWTNPQVASVNHAARLLFIATWNFADDHGNLPRDPEALKNKAFPSRHDAGVDVEPLIVSLIAQGLLIEYSVSDTGERFLHIPTFTKHQVINRRSKPIYPLPDKALLDSLKHGKKTVTGRTHARLTEHSRTEKEVEVEREREREREREKEKERTSGSSGVSGTSARMRKVRASDTHPPTGPASITLAMRQANITGAQPSNPRIVALADAGVTPEVVNDACEEAHRVHPHEAIPVAYVCSILERWQREPQQANGHGSSPAFDERSKDRKRTVEGLTGRSRRSRDTGEVIDVPAKEIGHAAKHS
ncbi:hypothetical protein [Paraburkholderia sp. 40]|uniref:hypothetical protein n=1 Tax=Paraburkholderia sp. 40 TaxID=2991059 RepID=UPI003D247BC2